MTWDDPGDASITKYQYRVFNEDGSDCSPWDAGKIAASATSHTIKGLENDQRYQIRLRAVNAAGGGGDVATGQWYGGGASAATGSGQCERLGSSPALAGPPRLISLVAGG